MMVSSAFYPRLDRVDQAVFSAPVVTGLLRQRMGFGGVVVSDDLGSAASVARVPVGQRATRFVAAGGDIVLTTVASQAPVMRGRSLGEARREPGVRGPARRLGRPRAGPQGPTAPGPLPLSGARRRRP